MPPGPRPPRQEDSDYNNGTRTDQAKNGKKIIPFVPVSKKGRQAENIQAAAQRRLNSPTSRNSNPQARVSHQRSSSSNTGPGDYTRVAKGDHLGTSERAMGSNLDQIVSEKKKKESPSIAAAAKRAIGRKAV